MGSDVILQREYRNYRNQLTKIIRVAKYNYHKNLLSAFKNNSNKLWSHLNNLIASAKTKSVSLKPNNLNNFFTSVFRHAPPYNAADPLTIPLHSFINHSMFLSPITANEIISTFASLSNSNSPGTDGLSPQIIKANAPLLAHQLAHVYNLSFSQGIFPKLLKNAIIIPIFKGSSYTDPSNYRPISVLTIFSKLLEKLFYSRLIAFVDRHNILHSNQFGFRKHKSTNTAIASVLSNLLYSYTSNKKTVLALLDLKKAFDFINHDLLLMKLKHYGVRGTPLQWLTSYLANRTQKVKANNMYSDVKLISAGVPQGSILDPLLFIIFVNDVFQFLSHNVQIYLYADDTAIVFTADSDANLQVEIDNFFIGYSNWCSRNCIVVNPVKSNFLSFNTSNITVSINGQILINPHVVKYLGVHIDDKLSWAYHVSYVTRMCCQRIGVFKKVLPYLPNFVTVMYFNAFIRSSYSYGLMFWFHNNRSGRYKLIDKIDHLIYKLAFTCNLTVQDFVNRFHICDLWKVLNLQCLSFMYDLWHKHVNIAFISLIPNTAVHTHYTRTSVNLHVSTVTTLDKHNFVYNALLAWNECPDELRTLPKLKFISQCKAIMFT